MILFLNILAKSQTTIHLKKKHLRIDLNIPILITKIQKKGNSEAYVRSQCNVIDIAEPNIAINGVWSVLFLRNSNKSLALHSPLGDISGEQLIRIKKIIWIDNTQE